MCEQGGTALGIGRFGSESQCGTKVIKNLCFLIYKMRISNVFFVSNNLLFYETSMGQMVRSLHFIGIFIEFMLYEGETERSLVQHSINWKVLMYFFIIPSLLAQTSDSFAKHRCQEHSGWK